VRLLRTTLYLDALVWTATGFLLAVAPAWTLETVFDQVPLVEEAWVRTAAIVGIGMAMLMVIVAQRIETLWWAAWAFVLTQGALMLLAALNAAFGLPEGSSALFWWLAAGVGAAFTVALLAGLAKTGLERQPE
jgi:hypothetical protein